MSVTRLVTLALIGVAAQLVDGALGMAYGVTASSLLLTAGTSPAIASASVHLAEIGTTLVAGASHWRMGNVRWRTVALLAGPGAVGGFAGATVLSGIDGTVVKPWVGLLLLVLGIRLVVKFGRRQVAGRVQRRHLRDGALAPLGLLGGFVDAVGGGGWGPVTTSTLLSSTSDEPRYVIGTVSASEFAVTVAASAGFLAGLGTAGFDVRIVGGLLAGGLVVAPFSAWLVRHVDARRLGLAVGVLIVVTNLRTVLGAAGVEVPAALTAIATVGTAAFTMTSGIRGHRAAGRAAAEATDPDGPTVDVPDQSQPTPVA